MISYYVWPGTVGPCGFFLFIIIIIVIVIIIISYRFLNVEVLPVVLSNSEYRFSVVYSNMYLGNKNYPLSPITFFKNPLDLLYCLFYSSTKGADHEWCHNDIVSDSPLS